MDSLGNGAVVSQLVAGGHHPRAHIIADVQLAQRHVRLFLKALKPERQEAELFAYDHLLPLTECNAPKVLTRFHDWEYPTLWLVFEHIATPGFGARIVYWRGVSPYPWIPATHLEFVRLGFARMDHSIEDSTSEARFGLPSLPSRAPAVAVQG